MASTGVFSLRQTRKKGGQRANLGFAAKALLTLALATPLANPGCARNPVSGMPEPVLTTEKGEIEQGNKSAEWVKSEIGLVDNPDLEAYVNKLGQRLAKYSPRKNIEYHFYLLDMVEPNAFALPGGHIYVSRGLLALINSESQLAAILGHEIGHVAARHSVRRQTANAPLIPLQIASAISGAATAIVSPRLGQMVANAGQLPGAFAMAAYGREQEQQADELGQQIAAAAGFDPEALARILETLSREEQLSGSDPNRTSFLRTHPPSPQRALDAEKYGRDLVRGKNQPPPLSRHDFLEKLNGLVVGPDVEVGLFVGNDFLHPVLGFGFELPEGWKKTNTPKAVIAEEEGGFAQVNLMIPGQGSDPMLEALALSRHTQLDAPPKAAEISGLKAARASTRKNTSDGSMTILITWIAYDDLIYRIVGASLSKDFETNRTLLEKSAESFHVLTEAERKTIKENRLRLVVAQPSESLEELGERIRSSQALLIAASKVVDQLEFTPDFRVDGDTLREVVHAAAEVSKQAPPP
ncbi:M48 family metalloprotease, partial [Myxococcota bacterium]|nr:M48 family metalloprotease [Myxococcota bacterium]